MISVPAYFSDGQRKATRAAGELAGIHVERLINEPTAAALAYGLQAQTDGSRFMIFDLGGGTFDVSVLEMFAGVVEVHASAGDNFLGGEDFLDVLLKTYCNELQLSPDILSPRELGLLRQRLERAKRSLSTGGQASIEWRHEGRSGIWTIDEERFSELCEPLVQRMRQPLERAMRDAKLQPTQLDEIVVVGGAGRMQLVARLISRMFGRLPLRHVNPDQAIALGACIAAGMKMRDQSLEEVILTDICPYTLGIEVSRESEAGRSRDGFFFPIIHRNSNVPVSREEVFKPINDGQTMINLRIFQGENPMAANNILLATLELPLPHRRTAQENSIKVRFTYDFNGVLQVEAVVQSNGQYHELVIEQNPGLLKAEDIRIRLSELAQLKIHPRAKQENIALLARAERLYEECLDARAHLQQWIVAFRDVMDEQNEGLIRDHRLQFSQALDRLESML